jgi:hypothetical protein
MKGMDRDRAEDVREDILGFIKVCVWLAVAIFIIAFFLTRHPSVYGTGLGASPPRNR